MMKTSLVVFASVVGVLQAQRYPTPPPPPPKAFQGSSAARHRPAGAGGVLGVHKALTTDSCCPAGTYCTTECNGDTCSGGSCVAGGTFTLSSSTFFANVTNQVPNIQMGGEVTTEGCLITGPQDWQASPGETAPTSWGKDQPGCKVTSVTAVGLTSDGTAITCNTSVSANKYTVRLGDTNTSCVIDTPSVVGSYFDEDQPCCPEGYSCYNNGTGALVDCQDGKCPGECRIPESPCCPDGELCLDGEGNELLCTTGTPSTCPAPGTCQKSTSTALTVNIDESGISATSATDKPYEAYATGDFRYTALYYLCTTGKAVQVRNALRRFDRRSHWFVYVGKGGFYGSYRRDQVTALISSACGYNMAVFRVFKPQLPNPCPRLAAKALIDQAVSSTVGRPPSITARYIYANEIFFGIQHVFVLVWDNNNYQWASHLVQTCAAYNTKAAYYLNTRRNEDILMKIDENDIGEGNAEEEIPSGDRMNLRFFKKRLG